MRMYLDRTFKNRNGYIEYTAPTQQKAKPTFLSPRILFTVKSRWIKDNLGYVSLMRDEPLITFRGDKGYIFTFITFDVKLETLVIKHQQRLNYSIKQSGRH